MKPNKQFYQHFLILLAILLPIFLLAKSYILYTTDSGAYLLNSRELKVPGDRSIFYSVLIFLLNVIPGFFNNPSLIWFVFLQIFLTYWIVYQFVKIYFDGFFQKRFKLFLLLFFLFSPTLWLAIQIMPDIFTVILFFAAMLFLKSTNYRGAWLFGVLVYVSLLVHNSNVLLFLFFSGGMFLLRAKLVALNLFKPRFLQLFLVSIFAISTIFSTNIYANGEVSLGVSSEAFFMGKLCENGILKKYLDKYCDKEPNALCAYKDKLPEHSWDFIWEENGAFANSGGWHNSDSLYKHIIRKTLTDPELFVAHIKAATVATIKQIGLIGAGDGIVKLNEQSTIVNELKTGFPYDFKLLNHYGAQQKESIPFSDLNKVYLWVSWLVICLAGFLLFKTKNIKLLSLFFIGFYFTLCNAFVTGAMANVLMRLNTKGIIVLIAISWLILIYGMQEIYEKKRTGVLKDGSSAIKNANGI